MTQSNQQKSALDLSLDELERVVARWRALGLAAKEVIEQRQSTFRAKNGRDVGIEDEGGEKMWIVPFEAIAALESALDYTPGERAQEGEKR